MKISTLDKVTGMYTFLFPEERSGGIIRSSPEDFIVEEILSNGLYASYPPKFPEIKKGRYSLYLLERRDIDLFICLNQIANHFSISRDKISFAGIKDKRAVSRQFISIKYGPKRNIERENFKLLYLTRFNRKLSPRYLVGNRFTVRIRNCDISQGKKLIEKIRKDGFPNFFGYQRFGAFRPINHWVGYYLIKRKFGKATLLLIGYPGLGDSEELKKAKEKFLSGGTWSELLGLLPKSFHIEHFLLRQLQHNVPPERAILKLPFRILRIFMSAFSSYVFNLMLSGMLYEKRSHQTWSDLLFLSPLDKWGNIIDASVPYNEDILRSLSQDLQNDHVDLVLPVFGYLFSETPLNHIFSTIFNIPLKAFYFKEFPVISYPGSWRRCYIKPYNLSYRFDEHSLILKFFLPRGVFATSLLREVMKPQDPFLSGF